MTLRKFLMAIISSLVLVSISQGTSTSATSDAVTIQVEAGDYHSCALLSDGTVWCWGSNKYGQLGDGSFTNSDLPKKVVGLPAIKQISLFAESSCALDKQGQIWCWGESGDGEFLQGAVETCIDSDSNGVEECHTFAKYLRQKTPLLLPNVTSINSFDIGPYTICAINDSKELLCWGDPHTVGVDPAIIWVGEGPLYGDNWDSDFSTYYEPYNTGLTNITQVSVGGRGGTCALNSSGEVWCFPLKNYGDGDVEAVDWDPFKISALEDAVSISAENSFGSCALVANGDYYCWDGYDDNILGAELSKTEAVLIPQLTGITSLSSAAAMSCGIRDSVGVYCWGTNYGYLLSDQSESSVPPTLISNTSDIKSLGVGWVGHICALTTSGTVKCWGSDTYGQLGDGAPSVADPAELDAVLASDYSVLFEEDPPEACGENLEGTVFCGMETARSNQSQWQSIKFSILRNVSVGKSLKVFTTVPTPTLIGNPTVGSTLKFNLGRWKPTPKKFSYQWLMNGMPLSGKTQSSLKLDSAHINGLISVRVTAELAGYSSVSITSSVTSPVLNSFSRTSKPKIAGTAKVGKTLTIALGYWYPSPDSVTVQWLANGSPILGATNESLLLSNLQVGKKISVRVIAIKEGYVSNMQVSSSTSSVKK